MSEIGMSTSCFYPLETEKSLEEVGKLGFHTVEMFINSYTELDEKYINEFYEIIKRYGMNLVSVHTTASFADGYNYFSDYYRRFEESMDVFRREAYLAEKLGAKFLVMHGMKTAMKTPDEVYCERFSALCDVASEYNLHLLQENVVYFKSETPDYIEYMRKNIDEKFAMVLDVKQARRAGVDPFEFIERHHRIIKHIHISDFNESKDCITPLEGYFDFSRLFSEMKGYGYDGDYIIELYKHSYKDKNDILLSAEKLNELLKRAK